MSPTSPVKAPLPQPEGSYGQLSIVAPVGGAVLAHGNSAGAWGILATSTALAAIKAAGPRQTGGVVAYSALAGFPALAAQSAGAGEPAGAFDGNVLVEGALSVSGTVAAGTDVLIGNVSVLQSINSLTTRIAALENTVGPLPDEINNLSQIVATDVANNGTIASLQTQIADLQANVATMQAQILTLQAAVSSLQASAA